MEWTERLTLALTAGYLVSLAAVFVINEPVLWVLWAAGAVGIVGVVLLVVNRSKAVPVTSEGDERVSAAETGTGTEKPAATEDGAGTNADAERD
ncbi:hypothetical protein [Natrialba asiatica]|uniref:Uncharacterized protein n=1 Tax=Natrialba asiatica (strain ATCC 700177 / DSM 12278 / JCM 9576 / FERM P-10747 / NBRC 102637 / 172P1) TaxID=29540 RepID=M0ATK9_NATA1|nr:hypothetical protein [Natrialba asiatica]ELZ02016.1 hypothetical protein C481_09133 [Natrialba asiatica DSM 12278]